MKIDKSLEESSLFIKGVSKTIKNDAKEQKGGFLGMLLGKLGVSLLGNLLIGKGTIRLTDNQKTNYDDNLMKLEKLIHTLKDKTSIYMNKMNETNTINQQIRE